MGQAVPLGGVGGCHVGLRLEGAGKGRVAAAEARRMTPGEGLTGWAGLIRRGRIRRSRRRCPAVARSRI
jgi:hypothetical protein